MAVVVTVTAVTVSRCIPTASASAVVDRQIWTVVAMVVTVVTVVTVTVVTVVAVVTVVTVS